MSQPAEPDGRAGGGRFGAATPGTRPERTVIGDLTSAPGHGAGRRRVTPWRLTALIAALLVAGGSYLLGRYVVAPAPPRTVTLTVTAVALPAGASLTAADLRAITVQGLPAPPGAASPAAAGSMIGQVVRVALPAGTIISRGLFASSGALPDAAQALVGLALKPGQLPAGGLAVGQQVLVILLPVTAQGTALTPVPLLSTTVWQVASSDVSGAAEVTVIVPASVAAKLASFAARGQVSLVATAAAPTPSAAPTPGSSKSQSGKKPKRTSSKRSSHHA